MTGRVRILGWILFFGTLWGASEVLLNEGLRALAVPRTSVPLNVVAVLILGFAALRLPRFGALVSVAVVAGAYRTLTAGPFWCHVLAVLTLGVVFDVLRRVLEPSVRHPVRTAVLGGVAAFAAHAAFGVLITYVFAYRHWTGDGGARFRDYVLVSGLMAAMLAAVLLPLTLRLMQRERAGAAPHRLPAAVPMALTVLLWIAGFVF
jgi:hypothetical protein